MSEITSLLERAKSSNKKERQKAVKELGNLDKRYSVVIDLLQDLEYSDPEKGVRKEAEKSLNKLEKKPLEEPLADKESGEEGTAFDDEVGDDSLKPGEYDVETSLSKEEEDRRERMAEGKGIKVTLIENNQITMNNNGEVVEKQQSSGTIIVANTGNTNRISGVDLELRNIDNISSDEEIIEKTSIGLLVPGREKDWKLNYNFDKEIFPIKVEQSYKDPETEVSPNFAGGERKDFELMINISNTTDEKIHNVKGIKTFNEFASMSGNTMTSGTISATDDGASFEIPEINPDEIVTITLSLNAVLPEDVPSYKSGELKVTYENKNKLVSGLEFVSVDGISDVRRRIRRKQRETEPTFYDAEFIFENKSEFVYDLNKFTVFADSIESQQIVLDWDGASATQNEREVVPGEKISFEFVYESAEGAPTFGDYVEFSVQHEVDSVTQTTVTLLPEELRYMALDIIKSFMKEGEIVNRFELPSYVETIVPTVITVTGVGTYPLEGLAIRDEIPEGFKDPSTEQVLISRGERELYETQYSATVETHESGEKNLVITLDHLEETVEGGLKEGEVITIKYSNIAANPVPQDDPIKTIAFAEGFIYLSPDTKVKAISPIDDLELVVVHKRDDIDIGKMIESLEYEGQNAYKIRLEAENYGNSIASFFIEDLIPEGFKYIEGSMQSEPDADIIEPKSISEGSLRGWKFENVQPNEEVWASYVVVEDSPTADPRKLQSVYRG